MLLHSYNQIWFSNKQFAGFTLGGYSDSNPVETGKAAREALGMLARKEIHAEIQGVYPLENAAEALSSFGREEHGRKTGFENISPNCCGSAVCCWNGKNDMYSFALCTLRGFFGLFSSKNSRNLEYSIVLE